MDAQHHHLKTEVSLLKSLDHPNIVKLFESFKDARNAYLVMELCEGGELLDRMKAESVTESQVACIMEQIFRAVIYIHQHFVAHRDLMPSNFLLATQDPVWSRNNCLKMVDFGLSCAFDPGEKMTERFGTPHYMAPEVFDGQYDELCDEWSCGVTFYQLISGNLPFGRRFQPTQEKEIEIEVKQSILEFESDKWEDVSTDATALIKRLLDPDPSKRITAQNALLDPWVEKKAPRSKQVPLTTGIVDNLKKYALQSRLKKAALQAAALHMDDKTLRNLKDVFITLDKRGDGLLWPDEFKAGLEAGGCPHEDVESIMEGIDLNGRGAVDYSEFIAAAIDKKEHLQEDVCWQVFRSFDRNGTGKIDFSDLKEVLRNGHDEMEEVLGDIVDQILEDTDIDGDGMIDFNEFMFMMRAEKTCAVPKVESS
eukprot:gnl/TRDRNA2_/TRDRNA2_89170_c1_seq1.p1 gnl/TRDRNA2_/TRDRNA2_89170_c1~~gnl/TRDRNA2_/TRDRNA2_89170_c1_seq1.p1  ORF type:complete len:448 (-),score=79.76 gnl/TRDRNA2_/TRDRNA2_89170_c1_seq1:280-1551(-)